MVKWIKKKEESDLIYILTKYKGSTIFLWLFGKEKERPLIN